jgi:shikimate kinase
MNIILIGMPGCGKSTVGVLLAKTMLTRFVDTDLLLQNTYHKTLCDIIKETGLSDFKQKENAVLCALDCDNSVIATGGSAVYCEEGMDHLRRTGKVVYLQVPLCEIERRVQNIHTRGIAMEEGCTLAQLYEERKSLYEHYADVTVDCTDLTAEQCVQAIEQALQ